MYLISTYKEPIDLSEDDNSGQQVQLLAKKLVKSPQKKKLVHLQSDDKLCSCKKKFQNVQMIMQRSNFILYEIDTGA